MTTDAIQICDPSFDGSLTAELVSLIRNKPVAQVDMDAMALFTLDGVANMLAGNAKALLPGPSVLGLPEVREGAAVSSSSTRLTYSGSLGDRFAVTLTPAAGWGGVGADTGSAS